MKGFFKKLPGKQIPLSAVILVSVFGGVSSDSLAGHIYFSRANCANNESITWDWPTATPKWWRVISTHRRPGTYSEEFHQVDSGWAMTTRSAAVHWGEGTATFFGYGKKWLVIGQHYEFIPGAIGYAGPRMIGYSATNNCNLKDFFPDW